jgi:hypothetical protein
MAAENYVLLERIELNASAASITFANIPQSGYTDLKVVASPRSDRSGGAWNGMSLTFNGSTSTYSSKILEGGDSVAVSANGGSSSFALNSTGLLYSSTFANNEIYIPNYTSSNFKSVSIDSVSEGNQSGGVYQTMVAGLWSTTAAITSITLTSLSTGNNFVQYSTFSLYGLAAVGTTPAIAPKAAGGDVIAYDGTYWYHAFRTTGAFVPQTGLSCDLLVIGGGAGGAKSGGGAAGVLTYSAANSLTITSYTVTVGAGGAGSGTTSSAVGTSGGASSVNSVTGNGGTGGRGISAATFPAQGGDSGSNTGGAGGANAAYQGGGGGGGTAGNGTAGTFVSTSGNNAGGAGGVGSNVYSSWASATSTGVSGYYASGGGGGGGYSTGVNSTAGSASSGGGGAGGAGGITNATSGTTGTANTGGGGGGGGVGGATDGSGVAGGSGIVIIRYLAA